MELTSVVAYPYKIKKQNSKMYYTTFTEPYKYFRRKVSTRLLIYNDNIFWSFEKPYLYKLLVFKKNKLYKYQIPNNKYN